MRKEDPFRFNLRFDETDEDHRKVCDFLNACGRKKARYIVKAFQAYWGMNGGGTPPKPQEMIAGSTQKEERTEKTEEERHFVSVDTTEYSTDDAELSLMRKNYQLFDSFGEEL